jgi:hypothetical protein
MKSLDAAFLDRCGLKLAVNSLQLLLNTTSSEEGSRSLLLVELY